ncbi:dTDP-4-dehydrorhamnose 3,5-epimerase [Salinibacter ruber]|uniref:dTDP-4-dehydrorhamnose 3,5-epimerase n=1 Tax=Salinibacter ruber TaxID=146919 RepID=UPI00216A16C3|nr:dTDP-4-dehydrorhamnose 3,5-epimerase [Salinibacter ruber]MCS3634902.1 dTDP-4-dehydrorhamnose 3,5-epimerase [Salinibacter ruber]MCS3714623.1 dTDP-4-dehydrorhamnose 3,5-epimerase [Salinibacter ruber]
MTVSETSLPGVRLIEPDVYTDDRGSFAELWNVRDYGHHGLEAAFVQDNLSRSREGVLRGLHFQNPRPQGKLISVLKGTVYDVVVDVRAGADTFGAWEGQVLSAESGRQLYVPEGYAHGFVATSEEALFHYKCTDFYHPEADRGIRWDDPALAIDWPTEDPILSAKDAGAPALEEMPREALQFDDAR